MIILDPGWWWLQDEETEERSQVKLSYWLAALLGSLPPRDVEKAVSESGRFHGKLYSLTNCNVSEPQCSCL